MDRNIVKKQSYVTFYSPGTFMAETRRQEIHDWDIPTAVKMSMGIKERYNAVPYAFQFTTCGRSADELDSHEIARSGKYYLGGEVKTLQDIINENDPKNEILIGNMINAGWDKVVVNKNSYSWTEPLDEEKDVVLNVEAISNIS